MDESLETFNANLLLSHETDERPQDTIDLCEEYKVLPKYEDRKKYSLRQTTRDIYTSDIRIVKPPSKSDVSSLVFCAKDIVTGTCMNRQCSRSEEVFLIPASTGEVLNSFITDYPHPQQIQLKKIEDFFYASSQNGEDLLYIIACLNAQKYPYYCLRHIDWALTNWGKEKKRPFANKRRLDSIPFHIHSIRDAYLTQQYEQRKFNFDMFRRQTKWAKIWFSDGKHCIRTTFCQLNFFHWFFSMRIDAFMKRHIQEIMAHSEEIHRNRRLDRKKAKEEYVRYHGSSVGFRVRRKSMIRPKYEKSHLYPILPIPACYEDPHSTITCLKIGSSSSK
jgi:hypothetical protein